MQKNAEEIAIIGHTDCQVCKTTTMQLLERLKNLGIERHMLPDNVNEYFGLFGSERQNVINACNTIRHSPFIGPQIPVHGLLLDLGVTRSHSRPSVSNDNPYSEAQFKIMKYGPSYPERFASLDRPGGEGGPCGRDRGLRHSVVPASL